MPLYLTPILGDGSDANPFEPVGFDQPGAGWVDLRPDATVNAGRGVLWLPTSNADIRLRQLADVVNEVLTGARRTFLANALSLTLSATRFRDVLAELLVTHARTDGTRWRPLQFTVEGMLEIWLGSLGRIFAQRSVAGGSSFSETWPTAGTTITTGQDQPWNEDSGNVTVVGPGHLECVDIGADVFGRCTSAVSTVDLQTQATCTTLLGSGSGNNSIVGVICRKVDSTVKTFYSLWTNRALTNEKARLRKVVAGLNTTLGTDAVGDIGGSAQAYNVQANGSSIQGSAGSLSVGPVTDTAIDGVTVGGKLGGYFFNRDSTVLQNNMQIGAWSVSDLAAADTLFAGSIM